MHFDPAVRVFVLSIGAQGTTLWQFFFSSLNLFDSIFSGIVLTNRMHEFDKGICFCNKCSYGNREKTFFSVMKDMVAKSVKVLLDNMNLRDTNYHWKNLVD